VSRDTRPEPELLEVRVAPRARRSLVVGWRAGALHVSVTAAPSDGRANRAVADLLAAAFGVPPSSIELVSGARARDKRFRVGTLSLDDLRARLAPPEAVGARVSRAPRP
jgi:uncharacterized protein (TIGR00251 family)